eukprot:3812681-Pleurochrysis_carterae.AAC.1
MQVKASAVRSRLISKAVRSKIASASDFDLRARRRLPAETVSRYKKEHCTLEIQLSEAEKARKPSAPFSEADLGSEDSLMRIRIPKLYSLARVVQQIERLRESAEQCIAMTVQFVIDSSIPAAR